jgi:cyclophilin family peptidyl-prolyl cis-trans isomerase
MKPLLTITLAILFGINLSIAQEKEKLVLISTNKGDIKIKLYNETPKHRDNFLKLVDDKFYEGVTFHRVINQFMIQGGDPLSKKTDSTGRIGNGGPGYTLDAEIVPGLYHKKGALAAARLGDDVNPTKKSSGSQFYIVHGKTFSTTDLDKLTEQKNNQMKQKGFTDFLQNPENKEYSDRFNKIQSERDQAAFKVFIEEVTPLIDVIFESLLKYEYTATQKAIYGTQGGAPHLDGDYTVFGEVVEGIEIVDNIAAVPVDGKSKPLEDVIIEKMKVVKK